MRKMIKKFAYLLMASLLSISLVSCSLEDDLSEIDNGIYEEGNSGDTVVINSGIDDVIDSGPVNGGNLGIFSTTPDTLDPLSSKNSYVQSFLSLIYEGLVKLDIDQSPVPVLSDSWKVSGDGLTWSFHIRNDVSWQDGTAFTASDVEYTVQYLLEASTDSIYKNLVQNIATFAALDESNFTMVLRKPNSFTAEMMTFPILPRHKAEEIRIDSSNPSYTPVGTGPYELYSYTENEQILLKANKDWWNLINLAKETEGSMYIENISVKLYKSADESISSFQAYDADMISIDCNNIGSYTGRTDLNVRKFLSREFEFLSFNMTRGIFSDLSARKAISASLDIKGIITDVMHGNAVRSSMPLLPDSWLRKGEIAENMVNSDSTDGPAEILKNGGWKQNDTGYYKTFAGVRKYLQFEILVNNNNSLRISVCRKIAEQLTANGIKSSVKLVSWDELLNSVNTGKYDMAFMGVRVPQYPDLSFLYSNNYITSLSVLGWDAGRNISGYVNPEINSNIEKIYTELDNEKQKTIYKRIEQIIGAEMPYIGLYFTNDAVLFRKTVRGDPAPNTWDLFHGISGWYVTGK